MHIKVYKDDKLFASKLLESEFGNGVINCGIRSRGVIGNLVRSTKILTLHGSQSDEVADVERCGVALFNSIKALGI